MSIKRKPQKQLYIYLDESGDLGFSGGGSKYFTIAYFITENKDKINRVVKRIKQKYKIPKAVELKAYNTKHEIKADLLEKLSELQIEIQSITVKKRNVRPKLRKDTNILYNYMVGLSLADKLAHLKTDNTKIIIIVDKRIISVENGFKINEYLQYKLWYEKRKENIDFEIYHLESHLVYGLQAIDNITNAIFKKYNSSKFKLYNIIQKKITSNKKLFFSKK